MKRDNINYLAVGLFVILMLAVALVALYRITGRVGDTEPYYVSYANIAGLGSGTVVTYEGFQVGYVRAIEPQQTDSGTRYRLELRIRDDWRIPVDSRARIHASGLLAETVIDIDEGKAREFLPPGAEIEGAPGMDLFAVLSEVAEDVGGLTRGTLKPLLENLDRQIGTVGGALGERVPRILADVESLVGRLDASAATLSRILDGDNEQRVDNILVNAERMSADLASLSATLRNSEQELTALIGEARGLVNDNAGDVRETVRGLRQSMDRIARSLDGMLADLESASRNMNEFSRQLRSNPGVLLNSRPPADRERP
ncbi:MlaD family protein [Thiohalobacter sp.]|uniref:MlaD family protein n=1 Tax=Thiohalobacter sp. TaxID=2025948 RepID=UPI0026167767|nr:MlaD family protein [Thiohalobacter sp.]